jgi:hypothetical protein
MRVYKTDSWLLVRALVVSRASTAHNHTAHCYALWVMRYAMGYELQNLSQLTTSHNITRVLLGRTGPL